MSSSPEYKPVIYKTARRTGELLGSSVVVATIQSLMTDRRYREEFTPFYFDLVINDEAHRSIYGDAREVVQFFQATRIGLTATPKAYLKNIDIEQLATEDPKALEARQLRDTYHYFGCEPGQPTFRYDIIDAVKDPEGPFLCLPKIFDLPLGHHHPGAAGSGLGGRHQRAGGELQDPGPRDERSSPRTATGSCAKHFCGRPSGTRTATSASRSSSPSTRRTPPALTQDPERDASRASR